MLFFAGLTIAPNAITLSRCYQAEDGKAVKRIMRGLMQHYGLSGCGLMDPGTHCISERGMKEKSSPHPTLTHTYGHQWKKKVPINTNYLPASIAAPTCHIYMKG